MDSPKSWQDVTVIFIASVPAMVAALSSLRNGRKAKEVKEELERTNGHLQSIAPRKPRHNTSGGTIDEADWYKAPDL